MTLQVAQCMLLRQRINRKGYRLSWLPRSLYRS
jgi:hypothetical protein